MLVSKQTIARTPTRDHRQKALGLPPRYKHVATAFRWINIDLLREKPTNVPDMQWLKIKPGVPYQNLEKQARRRQRRQAMGLR